MVTIEVYAAPSYGRERFYPANDQAQRLLLLLRKKSFTDTDLILIKALGLPLAIVERPKNPLEEKSPAE
jgi:hypothetical protein